MKRVMIVDDAGIMRASLRVILEKNGYEVCGEAENGLVAVNRYKELNPDIITMDITMPVMDGIKALNAIKDINKNVKVLMLSAMGQDALVAEAVLSGARGFVVKPFKEEVLVNALKKLE